MSFSKPTTVSSRVSTSMSSAKWSEAIHDAELRLHGVTKERDRLLMAIRVFRRQLRDGARWPTENTTDGFIGQEGD